MAETGKQAGAFAAFNFTLDVDGLSGSHGFSECSGANTEQDVIEYREGNMDFEVVKLPGLKKHGDITLRRGFTTNRELWDWRRNVLEGTVVRRDGHIVLNDEAGKPALRWKFTNAWPKQYSAPSASAASTEVAVEELVLVVEGFELNAV
ncbi:phage tail protein [Streptomyces roseochromogenus]|nr:phage tail protein [Streptomyces roseochromogenus]